MKEVMRRDGSSWQVAAAGMDKDLAERQPPGKKKLGVAALGRAEYQARLRSIFQLPSTK